jgi:cell wall-associated NlpC family hydrolase
VAIRIRKQLKRRPRSNRAGAVGRSTLATGAIAMVAMVVVGGAAFARPVGPTDKPVSAQEWTEAEKYGFGETGDQVDDRGLVADAARWQGQADAFAARQKTIGDSVASRAENFVNNYYGFGDAGDQVDDRRLVADAARWQGQADAFAARQKTIGDSVASRAENFVNNYYGFGDSGDRNGSKVASVPPSSPVALPEPGLSLWAMAITFFTPILVAGIVIMFVRRGSLRSAI